MLGRDSEDEIWSRFVFEFVIWPQDVTLVRWTQSSGPLCLWQCFLSLHHSERGNLKGIFKIGEGWMIAGCQCSHPNTRTLVLGWLVGLEQKCSLVWNLGGKIVIFKYQSIVKIVLYLLFGWWLHSRYYVKIYLPENYFYSYSLNIKERGSLLCESSALRN